MKTATLFTPKLLLIFFAANCLFSIKIKAQTVGRFDIVIDEIMADPTPVVGLPDAEFIEIKNISGHEINLEGVRVKSLTTTSAAFPSYTLPHDSFLIVTSTSHRSLFEPFGNVIGVSSFPALNNSGTTLTILSKEGITIHAIAYDKSWYQNDVKSDGGWSLEMIDTHNACNGANNWKASESEKGATPGAINSVNANNPDETAPALIGAAAIDSLTIELTFSESVDSSKAADVSNYTLTDLPAPFSAVAVPPLFQKVQLTLSQPLLTQKVYSVIVANVTDCAGNVIQAKRTARFGIAETLDSLDVVINEVLFNPKPGDIDYVELYNRSNKILNLKELFIANRSSTTNALGSIRPVSNEDLLFIPGDFYVISENGAVVKQSYFAKNPDNFIDVDMPSFPNDKGSVVLLNESKQIIDEFDYNENMHFGLINNNEGVSLERIDYNKPTQSKDNWTSASSTVGFGTPSYQNSAIYTNPATNTEITVTPKTFSPDNDGFDDFAIINYKIAETGFVGNITIFDATGRPVKELVKNATLGSADFFRWDGLDDKLRKVPVGIYIVYTEIFNLNGKKRSFKNTVVVARRFG